MRPKWRGLGDEQSSTATSPRGNAAASGTTGQGGCATAISRADGRDWGDCELGEDLRSELLPAPDLVLSGHQHAPRAWHAPCGAAVSPNPGFNAGGGAPNVILLDLAGRRMARWHEGGPPAGALRLPDAPDRTGVNVRRLTTFIGGELRAPEGPGRLCNT